MVISRIRYYRDRLSRTSILNLTPEQALVVKHSNGHAKVTAVAGAGKTTTLALFLREQLVNGQNPKRVLVIMYNKAAQLEFEHKLKLVISTGVLPQVRTFHSLGLRIYQRLIQDGILPAFADKLLGHSETESVLWQMMQRTAPSDIAKDILEQKKKWVEPMMAYIDRVKAELDPPQIVFDNMGLPKPCQFFPNVFEKFEAWRKAEHRISFNDMLYDPCQLFSKRPDIANQFANHMNWILVDEYQDINPIQQFLLKTLAGERSQVMVIGDPDQTIYEFRGSRPEFMQTMFDEEFKPVTHYQLSQTFRYGHLVSLMANQLIDNNPARDQVYCISANGNPNTQVKPVYQDDYGQAAKHLVMQQLEYYQPNQIAILNRLWGISAPIELALLEANIPYKLDHPGSVLDRMELQPFIFLLSVASGEHINQTENERFRAWEVFLTLPYLKVKRALLEQVARVMSQATDRFVQYFDRQKWPDLTVWQKQQMYTRIELVGLAEGNRIKAHQLFNRHVRETDFYKGLSDSAFSKQQVDDRIATVQAFIRFALSLDLSPMQLHEHLNVLRERKLSQEQNKQQGVLVTSIHKAKGLEWPVVILPGLTEYYYPYQPDGDLTVPASEESERRLLYVAMTRAKEQLHLVMPTTQGSAQGVSPFVKELCFDDCLQLFTRANDAKAGAEDVLSVSHNALSVLNHYILTMKWSVKIAARKIDKPRRLTKTGEQKAGDRTLRHKKFGEGTLKKEDARYLHIEFKDGQKRVLDKRIASTAIEWLPSF